MSSPARTEKLSTFVSRYLGKSIPKQEPRAYSEYKRKQKRA